MTTTASSSETTDKVNHIDSAWEHVNRSKFREQPYFLSPEQRATLESAVAELIPRSGDRFHSVADVGADDFIAYHVSLEDYPLLREGFEAVEAAAGAPLEGTPRKKRSEVLRVVDTRLPKFFTILSSFEL